MLSDAQLASWQSIGLVDGFVLPKIDMQSLADWRLALSGIAIDTAIDADP